MYKKILVPLDGSDLSEHALEHLDAIAMADNSPGIILLRVVEPLAALVAGGSYALDIAAEAKEQAEVDAQEYLTKIADGLKKKGMSIETVVTDGDPADVILSYAAENKVGLIIMSTHGRSGMSRWFFGSVAEKVLRHSTVPVLISPPLGTRASN